MTKKTKPTPSDEFVVTVGSVPTSVPCYSITEIVDQIDMMSLTGIRTYARMLKFQEKMNWVHTNLGGCYVGIVPVDYDQFSEQVVPALRTENVPLTIEPEGVDPIKYISLFLFYFDNMEQVRQFNEQFTVHGLPGEDA